MAGFYQQQYQQQAYGAYAQPAAAAATSYGQPAAAANTGARVKEQLGPFLICEDNQGEYYQNTTTGQMYDVAPPELVALRGGRGGATGVSTATYGATTAYGASTQPAYSTAATYAAPTTYAAPMAPYSYGGSSYVPPPAQMQTSSFVPPAASYAPATTYAQPTYTATSYAQPSYEMPRTASFVPQPSLSFVPPAQPQAFGQTALYSQQPRTGSFVPPVQTPSYVPGPQPQYGLQTSGSMVTGYPGMAGLQSAPSMLAYTSAGAQPMGGFQFYGDSNAAAGAGQQPPGGAAAPGAAPHKSGTAPPAAQQPAPAPGAKPTVAPAKPPVAKKVRSKKKSGCC